MNSKNTPSIATHLALKNILDAQVYSGSNFLTAPGVQLLKSDNSLHSATDLITLSAFLDSQCSLAAAGTLAASQNPMSMTAGLAQFADFSYTISTHLEETIYIKARDTTSSLSLCFPSSTSVLQHFNTGFGYITTAGNATGLAGAPAAVRADVPTSVIIDTSGRYVVGGHSRNASGGTELFVTRYFPDGTVDSSFGIDGIFLFNNDGIGPGGVAAATRNDTITQIGLDLFGRIVAIGNTSDTDGGRDLFLLRLLPMGFNDPTLNGSGIVVFNEHAAGFGGGAGLLKDDSSAEVTSLLIDSTNRYVTGIASANAAGNLEIGMIRILSDGGLDPNFGTGGVTLVNHNADGMDGTPAAARSEAAYHVMIDGSGRYLLNGLSNTDGVVVAFTAAGVQDTTFGSGGFTLIHSDQGFSVPFVSRMDAQKRIVGASAFGNNLGVYRLKADGTFDGSFGTDGILIFNPTGPSAAGNAAPFDYPLDLNIDSAGRYVIGGGSINAAGGTELTVWRFLSTGVLDTSYNATGYAFFHNGGTSPAGGTMNENPVTNLVFDSFGRVVFPDPSPDLAGTQTFSIVRFAATGLVDL